MPPLYRQRLRFNASLIIMLPAIVLFWQSHLKTGQAQSASPRHKSLETALSTAGHRFSRQDLGYFGFQHKRLMPDILIQIVWEKMELTFQITPYNRPHLSIFREAFQSIKCHRLKFCLTKSWELSFLIQAGLYHRVEKLWSYMKHHERCTGVILNQVRRSFQASGRRKCISHTW